MRSRTLQPSGFGPTTTNDRILPLGGTPQGQGWERQHRLYFSDPLEMGGLPDNFAEKHTGVCLVFSTKLDESPLFPIYKVYYEDTLPTFNPFSSDNGSQLLEIFITKATEYAKEEEWRVWEEKLGPGKHPFNPDQLEGLIFGAKASDDFIAEIVAINQQRSPSLFLGRAVLENNGESINVVRLSQDEV